MRVTMLREGQEMDHGRTLHQFYQKRIGVYTELKELLTQQQQALLENDAEKIRRITTMQLTCLENIQQQETAWLTFLKEVYGTDDLSRLPSNVLSGFQLPETQANTLRQHQQQLRGLLQDIAELKESNQVLVENSLGFINTLLSHITEGIQRKGVYQPGKKTVAQTGLVNRTL